MSPRPVAVMGASGKTGRRVTVALQRSGHPVRPVTRHSDIPFDWDDAEIWRPAMDGVHALYLMAPETVPVDPAFVELAVEVGVQRIVLLSSGAIEEMQDERLLSAEQSVRSTAVEWTILRPSWLDQNFDEGFFRPAVMAGQVLMPVGDLRQAFVDAADVAAVAATVLTEPGHAGHTYELHGPQALTFAEAVEIIAQAAGRPVSFDGSVDAYVAAQTAQGRNEEEARAEVQAFEALARRGHDEPNGLVQEVTGEPATTFQAYASAAAAGGAWRD